MLRSKIKNLRGLKKLTAKFKKQGKTIVFTNGCFDILHYGHVQYLEDAKAKGDILIVAINSDASIKRIKGSGRPIVNQNDRIRIIAGLECVDYAVIFNEDTPLETILAIKPDILIKGSDWNTKNIVGSKEVQSSGGKVATIKLVKGRSTTNLINKIVKKF